MSTVGFDAGTASAPGLYVNTATSTGIYSNSANEIDVTTNSSKALSISGGSSGVNYIQLNTATPTGSSPVIRTLGSDTDVGLTITTQGGGSIGIAPNGATSTGVGLVSIAGGSTVINGVSGGNLLLHGGQASGTNGTEAGGYVSIVGGSSTSYTGGTAYLFGGNSTNSLGGNVVLNGGSGNGGGASNGRVYVEIGTNNIITVQDPVAGAHSSVIFDDTGSVTLPIGTTAQRSSTPVNGMIRYNSSNNNFEGYQNGAWSAFGSGSGTVTSVGVSSTGGTISVTGSPITSSGTINVDLPTSGVTAGTYNNVTVNNKGIVTSGSNTAYLTANQNITVSGDATGSGTTAIALTLANSGVTAGTYNNLTVNAKGLVTSGSNTAYLTANQTITLSGDVTGSGTTAITGTLAASGVTAGTYNNPTITVDAKGRVTSASNGTSGSVPAIGAGEAYQTLQVDTTSSTYQLVGPINYANKNVIIGGDFSINPWQRGTSFTNASGYTADRFQWYSQGGSGQVTVSRQSGGPDPLGTYYADIDVTTADASPSASSVYGFYQPIEGQNVLRFGLGTASAQKMTLSFWVSSPVTGTHCVAIKNPSTRSYVATYNVTTANTWQFVTITLTGDTTGTWATDNTTGLIILWPLAVGSTYQTTGNTWTSGNYAGVSGMVNIMGTAGNHFKLDRVQLELGPVATAFERLDVGTTLAKCQRYYYVNPAVLLYGAYVPTYGAFYDYYGYPVSMRATPSVSFSNLYYSNCYGITATTITASGLNFGATCSSTGAAGLDANITCNAEL